MAYLGIRQAQQLSAALTPLYTAPHAGDLYDRLSATVNTLLGAEMTCFDFFDQQGHMLNLGGNAPTLFTPELLTHLAEHVAEHPLFPGIFIERSAIPLKISDFCAQHKFASTDIFNDFYRPIAVTHQLIVGFEVPGQGFTTCALSRSRHDFSETERTLLAFVQPHLVALLQLARQQATKTTGSLPSALGLTAREADILRLLAQGRPDKEIAQHCRISPRTVQVHLRNIYAKLGVDNRTAASLRAVGN